MLSSKSNDLESASSLVSTKTVLPLWKLCMVAAPQFGIQCLWTFMSAAMMPYLGELGFPAWASPLVTFAGPVTGFFADPIIGAWSDHSTSRFGRRRPVILAGFVTTLWAGFFFAACPRFLSGPALLATTATMQVVLGSTINLMQTPIRALVSEQSSADQSTTAMVIVMVIQGLGALASFGFQKIWQNPADHMIAMFALMIGVNAFCVTLMLLVTKETPFVAELTGNEVEKASCCTPIVAVFRSMLHAPKFLLQLAVVQTLVWVGITMWNNNGSLWFGVTLFGGISHAAAGSPEKVAFDNGIAAFNTAGIYQSIFTVVVSLLMVVVLSRPRAPLRFIYATCIFIGAFVGVLAFFAVEEVALAQLLTVIVQVVQASVFIFPYALVAMASKRAEENGEVAETAMHMSFLNCYCTLGQLLSQALTALFRGFMLDTRAFPALFLLGGICQGVGACGVVCLKGLFVSPK